MNITDVKKLPTYRVSISNLSSARQISSIFKKHKIKEYIYTIDGPTDTIKHGISQADDDLNDLGDRLYRQLGNVSGWPSGTLNGHRGRSFGQTMKTHFPNLTKDDLVVTIYDATNYPKKFNGKLDLEKGENALVESYKEIHNRAPLGNEQDTSIRGNKAATAKSTFGKFFK